MADSKKSSGGSSSSKKATKAEREELGAAQSGPLADIGNMKPIDSPEEAEEPKSEFVKDPSGKPLAFGGKVESDAVITNTIDETYPQQRIQSVYTDPDKK